MAKTATSGYIVEWLLNDECQVRKSAVEAFTGHKRPQKSLRFLWKSLFESQFFGVDGFRCKVKT